MTTNKFFSSRASVFILLGILAIIFFGYKAYDEDKSSKKLPIVTENISDSEAVFFSWKYEKATSLNLDGIPETNIFLEVGYENGTVNSKLVDTTPMGCNDLPDSKEVVVSGSNVAQCYGAGLGYWFKVTQGPNSYLVERKQFEEALPDQEPVTYQYEVIAEFPLYN